MYANLPVTNLTKLTYRAQFKAFSHFLHITSFENLHQWAIGSLCAKESHYYKIYKDLVLRMCAWTRSVARELIPILRPLSRRG